MIIVIYVVKSNLEDTSPLHNDIMTRNINVEESISYLIVNKPDKNNILTSQKKHIYKLEFLKYDFHFIDLLSPGRCIFFLDTIMNLGLGPIVVQNIDRKIKNTINSIFDRNTFEVFIDLSRDPLNIGILIF